MGNGNPKDEYAEAMENMRVYGNMRFAGLTVFIAITAGLLTFVFTNPSLQPLTKLMLKIGGVVVTLTFWASEVSTAYQWRHFARRAAELEQKLDFRIFSTIRGAPNFRLLPTTYLMWLMYVFVLIFWLASIIWSSNF